MKLRVKRSKSKKISPNFEVALKIQIQIFEDYIDMFNLGYVTSKEWC